MSSATKPVANKAASAFCIAAFTLFNSKSALGTFLRWQRARLGAPKAITVIAYAHKLARPVYSMLKQGSAYVDAGQEYYEKRYRSRVIQNMKRKAQELGFEFGRNTRGNNPSMKLTIKNSWSEVTQKKLLDQH